MQIVLKNPPQLIANHATTGSVELPDTTVLLRF
jgi:hypothetical protein